MTVPFDIVRHNYEGSGLVLATGARPRLRDPREDKYRLHATVPTADIQAIDLSKPHGRIVYQGDNGNLWDPRPAITNQGQKGACAAFAVCEIAEILCWQAGGGQPVILSGSDLYERVRKAEDGASWQEDSGSTLAGNLDIAMTGLYSEVDAPESDDLARNYDAETAGKQTYDYVLGHQPMYPGDGSEGDPDYFIKEICYALDQGYPVDLGSYWPNVWFNPDGHGVLPMQGATITPQTGGHSYLTYDYLPIFGGVFGAPNHWTPQWNQQVAANGYYLRPGEFLIPLAAFRGKNPLVFEARAVTPQPVAPAPTPDPTPQPVPATACRDRALAVADSVLADYVKALKVSPRAYRVRYGIEGAQKVRDGLAKLAE